MLTKIALNKINKNYFVQIDASFQDAMTIYNKINLYDYTTAIDLFCMTNLITSVDNIKSMSLDSINLAMAIVLTNNNKLLSKEERKHLIIEFKEESFDLCYLSNEALWIPKTKDLPPPLIYLN
tara:strand:- start:4713 stop:5081 length:369 start_codon:yes stop_codon:yes gene_type:complete